MPRYDFTSQRLYIDADLAPGNTIELDRAQANYLLNVLRFGAENHVLLFNGRDGEWRAQVLPQGRKKASLVVCEQTRPQTACPDLHYLFAPLKQARLEYMVQKAVEMGAGVLRPVITQHTQKQSLKTDRMRAQAIEAAEQCGILNIPEIHAAEPLLKVVQEMPLSRQIIFCDEGDGNQNPLSALENVDCEKLAVLIGPEGGFSEEERAILRAMPNVTPIPLGPRVLRADTAAVAALAIVQSKIGDWQNGANIT